MTKALTRTGDSFRDLVALMARLRAREGGCPWDKEQTFETIAPYTIEEAYEVADAIERNDLADLKSELGDLLFQVLFHSQMAHELGAFTIYDVLDALIEKMISRHPHVFGEDETLPAGTTQPEAWERIKAQERAAKSENGDGALAGVALALPALMRAEKLTKRAARVGFDWPDVGQVLEKLHEEISELEAATTSTAGDRAAQVREEMGDILFVCANLARKLGVDAENTLRDANAKFMRRFTQMERLAEKQGVPFETLSLDQQEALWLQVKLQERAAG